MSEKRKDSKGRLLRTGETQRPNGTYAYRYIDLNYKRQTIYAKTLDQLRQKENEDAYKVSMRSGNTVNVSDICFLFGGGGHPRAAGCLIQGTVEEVKEKIMKEVKKVL